jgi:hypothetical protein
MTMYDDFLADAIQTTGRITHTMFEAAKGKCSDETRATILAGVLISTALVISSGEPIQRTAVKYEEQKATHLPHPVRKRKRKVKAKREAKR